MTAKQFGTILIGVLLFACRTKEEAQKQFLQADTIGTLRTERKADITKEDDNGIKSVETIISYIDSLYDIKTITKTDSVVDFTKSQSNTALEASNGLLAYAKDDLKKYYRHSSFHFFVFKDRESAVGHFKALISLSKFKGSFDTAEGKKYYDLFSKGGCAYILYENSIIHHLRRCNYNEAIEKPKENNLTRILYDTKPPTENYFLRVSCGWTDAEIK